MENKQTKEVRSQTYTLDQLCGITLVSYPPSYMETFLSVFKPLELTSTYRLSSLFNTSLRVEYVTESITKGHLRKLIVKDSGGRFW